MCFVLTPYYHLCGHYGRPILTTYGRCARAERLAGACWDPQDIGIRTLETMCINCERWLGNSETDQINTSNVGPVDCHKFNQLVKLHRQTCDRRYCSGLSALSPSYTDNKCSASSASDYPSIAPTAYIPTADDLALRRPSTDSEISIASTAASTMSAGRLPPIPVVNHPSQITSDCSWTIIEEWTKRTHDDKPQQQETHTSINQHDS